MLVGIYCHHIPTNTPHSGWHGVTEVAKTANTAKMAKKTMLCTRACPTPPHTNPMESVSGITFSAIYGGEQKNYDFQPKKGGENIFSTFSTPPDPHPQPVPCLKSHKKMGCNGTGYRGIPTKNSFGDACVGQINDFTRG